MPAPHVVLLASSISLRPVFPYFLFSNSFPCHRSENSPVSLAIATLPKTPVSNPCVCHTSETPPGVVTLNVPTFNVQLSMRNANLPIGVALLNFHLLPAYPLSFHILAHSFALDKNTTLLFSIVSALFGKNNRGWGYPRRQNYRPGGHYRTGCSVRSLASGTAPCPRLRASSTGCAIIARTRSRSAGTSSLVSPLVSMVSCR